LFQANVRNGLAAVTTAHQGTWHIDKAAWSVDQDAGIIVFTTPVMRAEAPVQIIGAYNTEDGSWLWGWDHPSLSIDCSWGNKICFAPPGIMFNLQHFPRVPLRSTLMG
jgi:hypothetical protein